MSSCFWAPDLAEQFAGAAFTLEGDDLPPELRVQFVETGRTDGTYVVVEEEGEHRAFTKDAKLWYDETAPPISVPEIKSLAFFIPSGAEEASFSFCISDLRILTYE